MRGSHRGTVVEGRGPWYVTDGTFAWLDGGECTAVIPAFRCRCGGGAGILGVTRDGKCRPGHGGAGRNRQCLRALRAAPEADKSEATEAVSSPERCSQSFRSRRKVMPLQ